MNCKEVDELLLGYLDNEVNPKAREAIEAHLSDCPNCRHELEALANTQRELRQAFRAITASVSSSPYAWATIRQRLLGEKQRRVPIAELAKSKLKGGIEMLKSRQPVWKVALASVLGVALILTLCLMIPPLLGQSPEVRAEDIAKNDPAVQTLMAEKGLFLRGLSEVTAWVTPAEEGKGEIFHVHLMNPGNDTAIADVIVDVEREKVLEIRLLYEGESYVPPQTSIVSEAEMEAIIEIAKGDPEVQEMLDNGARIGKVTPLPTPTGGDGHEFVGVELLQGEKSWLVKIDLTEGEVVGIFESASLEPAPVRPTPPPPYTQGQSEVIAREYLVNSPTFAFDGIEESVELLAVKTMRCPCCWGFVFEFDCRHPGYGDRTGLVLAEVITAHTATVVVMEGEVISGIMDDKWDMMEQKLIFPGFPESD